jgi:hypothetical protein
MKFRRKYKNQAKYSLEDNRTHHFYNVSETSAHNENNVGQNKSQRIKK